jgi:hypothetical protein
MTTFRLDFCCLLKGVQNDVPDFVHRRSLKYYKSNISRWYVVLFLQTSVEAITRTYPMFTN